MAQTPNLGGEASDGSSGEFGGRWGEAQPDEADPSRDPGFALEHLDLQGAVITFDHAPDHALL